MEQHEVWGNLVANRGAVQDYVASLGCQRVADIVNVTYSQGRQYLSRFGQPPNPELLLMCIATHTALLAQAPIGMAVPPQPKRQHPDFWVPMGKRLFDALAQAVVLVSPECRVPVLCRFVYGLSDREIKRLCGLSVEAIPSCIGHGEIELIGEFYGPPIIKPKLTDSNYAAMHQK